MAEGHETPGTGPGGTPEGRGRLGEGDLLSERRARRAAESGEEALTRRAEAAEATVQTLERHVSSLQQRLREAEEDRRRVAELIEAEKEHASERDSELRRVKQREYAEQQLRVEAEDRLSGLERDSRLEVERLSSRLGEAEIEARELGRRLEGLERQLVEAEQAGAAQRASLGKAEQSLQARVAELERRAHEIQLGLQSERDARERSDRAIESMREGHRRMEGLLGEVKGIVARLGAALTGPRRESPTRAPAPVVPVSPVPAKPAPVGDQRGLEMADALAAAVERLRARAELGPEAAQGLVSELISPGHIVPSVAEASDPAEPSDTDALHDAGEQPAVAPSEAVEVPDAEIPGAVAEPAQDTPVTSQQSVPAKPTHKHTRSLIGRIRNRRKQRRAG
jgi:hypothetical protein